MSGTGNPSATNSGFQAWIAYWMLLRPFPSALFINDVALHISLPSGEGRTLKAVRDIDIAAGPIGISSTYYKLVAFGLSAFAAALAGAMWAQNISFAQPTVFRTNMLVFLLVVLIAGGLGYKWGPLIGGIFFVFIRQKLQGTRNCCS